MWRAPDGARLRFAHLERDAAADMYQGHNYTRVYVEEIGNFPSPAPVMKLMATLRSGAGVPVGLRATGNPGGLPYAARVAAAEALLDRGWGKPRQSHDAEITHRYVIEIPALMDNATWEAEALEHEPDKLQ